MSYPPGRHLGEVFITHRRDLRAIAFTIVGRADLADDVLQDAYIKAVEGACAGEVHNPFGYCRQIVRNKALDYYRSRIVEASIIAPSLDGELPEVAGDVQADAGIDERRLLKHINGILAALPERTRIVFELYRLHGETQREIGKRLGISATLVNFMIRDVMHALASARKAFDA